MGPLTHLSINRPILVLVAISIFVIYGIQAFFGLGIEFLPETDLPTVNVAVRYPGASPEDVADNVIAEIEDAVSGLAGVESISAVAQENFGSLTIQFVEGTDGDQATTEVDRAVSEVLSELPPEVESPVIEQFDPNNRPIMFLVLSGPQSADVLYNLADEALVPLLESQQGVASITLAGGREEEIQILADPTRLSAYGFSLATIGQALRTENSSNTAGTIESGGESTTVRAEGEFQSLAEIELLELGAEGVYLRNFATVQAGFEDTERLVRLNGEPGVLLTVVKSTDANAVAVADRISAQVDDFQRTLPSGAELQVIIDDTLFTESAVAGVQSDLMIAILITGLVLLFFLHTINSAGVVVMTVPVAILITVLGMAAFGFTLNTLTLLALTVAIGTLVDDAIVITENTDRHIKMGKSPQQAAFDATDELGFTLLATSLVAVVVYLPVAFLTGTVGQLFFPYAVTTVTAFAVSLILAFSLTPLLASWWMPNPTTEKEPTFLTKTFHIVMLPLTWLWFKVIVVAFEWFFNRLADGYRAALRFLLSNVIAQALVIAFAVASIYGGVWIIQSGLISFDFLPYQDNAQFTVTIELPPGSNLAATDRTARLVEDLIRAEVSEASQILTMVGAETVTAQGNSKNFANITVVMTDKRLREQTPLDVLDTLRPKLAMIPGADIYAFERALSTGSQLSLELYAPSPEAVLELREQVLPVIAEVPGATDVRTPGFGIALQEALVVNRERAKALGLSAAEISANLRTAINGTPYSSFTRPGETEELDIVLRVEASARDNLADVLQLPIGYVEGAPVRAAQVASVQQNPQSTRVERAQRQYAATVDITPVGGSTDVLNGVIVKLDDYPFPTGTGYGLTIDSQRQQQGVQGLMLALVGSVGLVYLLMVGLYESFLQPIAIISVMPVTIVGAVGGLYLTGGSLSIVALLGMIMLAGLVTKNAILLLDLTNTFRAEGVERKQALINAGHQRLRAILMTGLSLVFALIPMYLNPGLGSEFRKPLAVVVIFGTLVSIAFFIFLVPVFYNALDQVGHSFSRLMELLFGAERKGGRAAPPQPIDDDDDDRGDGGQKADPASAEEPPRPVSQPRPQAGTT